MKINGPENEITRFIGECFTLTEFGDGPHFDFNKLIPEPEWKEEGSNIHIKEFANAGDLALSPGASFETPAWYEWRCQHWGTKWNAYLCYFVRQGPGEMDVGFRTAWSPALPILEEVARRFPMLTMQGSFRQEFYEFAGNILISDGKLEIEDTSEQARAEHLKMMRYQERLAGYRRRLNQLAIDAQEKLKLTPKDVADNHIDCGHGVLKNAFGQDAADDCPF
jgi:hypothetical protein